MTNEPMKNEPSKILVADDEPDILEIIKYNLAKEGYQVFTASNGSEAIELAQQINPDLIILDIMMPQIDGIEACRQLRTLPQFQNTRITFLTARQEDFTQIAGFDAGADDYITKPIRPRLLVSRIKALLRRSTLPDILQPNDDVIQVGVLTIDRQSFTVLKENTKITLPKKEFELLALLASKPGRVFTREEIFATIWGSDVIVGTRTIDVHIRKIREKLELDCIHTSKGVGYKFEL